MLQWTPEVIKFRSELTLTFWPSESFWYFGPTQHPLWDRVRISWDGASSAGTVINFNRRLSACLLATWHKNYWADLRENFTNVHWIKKIPLKFGSHPFLADDVGFLFKDSSTLQTRTLSMIFSNSALAEVCTLRVLLFTYLFAWWNRNRVQWKGAVQGFMSSSDRQQIAAFIHRGVRRGFCPPDVLSIDELVSDMDDKLFNASRSAPTPSSWASWLWIVTHSDHEDTNSVSHPNHG